MKGLEGKNDIRVINGWMAEYKFFKETSFIGYVEKAIDSICILHGGL